MNKTKKVLFMKHCVYVDRSVRQYGVSFLCDAVITSDCRSSVESDRLRL